MIKDKICLVTGGSRGIGSAIVKKLAKKGAHVIFTYVNDKNSADRLIDSISDYNSNIQAIQMDVSKRTSVINAISHISKDINQIDVLVNNAGINKPEDFDKITDNDWDIILDVNLKGPFFISQCAAKIMKTNSGGNIVNVSSINGRIPMYYQSIYSLTKSAMISMTQSFAKELGPDNIRVNAILPGLTETKFSSVLTQNNELMKDVIKKIPLGRIAQPNEMSGMVLFLVSDAASYVTGSTFIVDGGILA